MHRENRRKIAAPSLEVCWSNFADGHWIAYPSKGGAQSRAIDDPRPRLNGGAPGRLIHVGIRNDAPRYDGGRGAEIARKSFNRREAK